MTTEKKVVQVRELGPAQDDAAMVYECQACQVLVYIPFFRTAPRTDGGAEFRFCPYCGHEVEIIK